MTLTDDLVRRVRAVRGDEPGDLLLRGGRIANVFTGIVEDGDVLVVGDAVAGVGSHDWDAAEIVELDGAIVAPGVIDAHMHVESTLLTPAELARLVVPRGTTAIVADPHEIGNVLGIEGIAAMVRASAGLPLACFYMAPSCVPASPFENAGANFDADAIAELLALEGVIGLAEMMNFPGVLGADPEVLAKVAVALATGAPVDGHAPGVVGRDLLAYAAAGIRSDHECTTAEEAVQRSALGMLVQVREGSMARNLDALLPLLVEGRLARWCLCSDDIDPEDLVRDGHIDHLLRRVVAAGVDPVVALRHAALVPAEHYGLGRGAVAPGWRADLAIFEDLQSFRAAFVVAGGRIVARGGDDLWKDDAPPVPTANTVHLGPLDPAALGVELTGAPVPVIGIVPDQIVTTRESVAPACGPGRWRFDAAEDLVLVSCIQRHVPSGHAATALVRGFGFARSGAIGSTVAHDAHNLIVAGTSADEIAACAAALADLGGGFAVVDDGVVIGSMALTVAGLLSTESAEEVCRQQRAVDDAASTLGIKLHSPFGTLSFLALTVIPELRITDDGLFDVNAFALV